MSGTYRFIAVLAALLLLAGIALGQVKSSAITGNVTDPSGALVPNAGVVVRNQETNVLVEVKSNAAGEYTVPYLAAGQYSVTVKAEGFRTLLKTDIVMGTDTTVRVDVKLVTGSVGTTVEVKADAISLQTESATVQGAVNQDLINNIPNINNNPLYYATLQAGVVPSLQMYNGNVLGVGYADRMQMSDMRINGGLVGTNDVQLDGISVQGAAWHETTVLPNRDAVQEVRTITNTFSADLGHGQGLISMTTKSGTNQFHGSANYRLRNEALNANGLYNNMYGIPRSAYRVNEYGGTIGGPVSIPKLFSGKDKLFFFASYERLTHSDAMNYQGRVPTALERQGNFSQTMVSDNNGNPTPVQVFDPFSAVPYQGSNQVFIRQMYQNAIITNPDPYGLKILQAYPLPNHAPTDSFQSNNYAFSSTVPTVRNNLATRLDYHLSDRQSFYVSGGLQNGSVAAVNAWGNNKYGFYNNANGQSTPKSDDNPYAMVGDTITLNPTTIVDVRYGVTRVHAISGFPVVSGINESDWGMPASVQSAVTIPGTAPSIGNFCGNNTNCNLSQLNFDGWNRKNEHQTNHSLSGSVTKVLGKWTLKQGAEYRVYLGNYQDLQYATPSLGIWSSWNSTGQFGDVSGNNLGGPFTTSPAQRGIDMAGVLVGAGGYSVAPGTSALAALAAKYMAFYSQNDWKVTPKLTLNLGLRYEIQPGPTERHNRASSLDLSLANQYASGLGAAGSPLAGMGERIFAGIDGNSRNLWDTQWNNISPRIGFAYRMWNSLVLRGGYGRTFTPSNTGFNANSFSYGEAAFANGANPMPYGLNPNGVPVGRFEDPQNTQVILAKGAVQDPNLYGNVYNNTGADSFRKHGFLNGQVDQWNFVIERTLGKDWLASVGYVGSHAGNLPWRWFPLNGQFQVPDSTLKGWRNQWLASSGTVDPATAQVPNPTPALIGQATGSSGSGTINAWQLGLPYQAFLGESYVGSLSTLNYNALEAKLQHAYSNGLTMMLNYTWSKSLGLGGGPSNSNYAESQINGGVGPAVAAPIGGNDYRNLQNNYGLMSYDIPQRFIGVVSYLLPTGKGQKLDPGSPVLRALVGGWQLGTVVTLQSGQPWGNNCGGMNGRCNIAPGEPAEVPSSLQHWYDGHTSVTLPDGRSITPAAHTFLKWNPDYWTAPMVQFPNGNWAPDQYQWLGTAHYLDNLRTPGLANVNLTVNRKFQLRERTELQFLAEATNAFNRTNFIPSAVTGGYSAVTVADPATNTKVGQNASIGAGSLSPQFLSPRQITLSLRLQF
jgi:hypothetical protein